MIRRSEILRGMLTRFLPAAIAGTSVVTLLLSAVGRFAPFMSQLIVGVVGTALLATFGATLAMLAVRNRLRSDADVCGRKSVVAGALASSLALAILGISSDTVSLILALPFIGGRLNILAMPAGQVIPLILTPIVSGALLAVGTYFPWFSRATIAPAQLGSTGDRASLQAGQAFARAKEPRARTPEPLPNEKL